VLVGEQDGVFGRVFAPIGAGVIDWVELLRILRDANPDLPVSIECAGPTLLMPIGFDDPEWEKLHPDLDPIEVATLRDLASDYAKRAERGEVPSIAAARKVPYDGERFVLDSAAALRRALAQVG
jgi:sugar phosphate isomerase/epimerase